MTHRIFTTFSCVLFLFFSLAATLLAGGPVFTDVTAQAGIALNSELVESLAWGDYDNDNDEDLFLAINGHNRLYRNEGGGQFTEVAASVGMTETYFSVGTAWGDLDNDGDLDLYVVSFGSGPDTLYRNDGPTGVAGAHVFTEIGDTAGIAADESSSRGVALIDYDQNGLLDIYVNAIGDDLLYRNLGNLAFENVSFSVGILGVSGQGVGVVASDVDGDGRVDLYTGNRSNQLNRLFQNQGGTFFDFTATNGLDEVGLGMGVLAFDYDNDLDMDLYWTSWPGGVPAQPNALYRNSGDASSFTNVAVASGTDDPDGWGISVNAGDVDGDGWNDFFVTNGFDPTTSANVLFHNQGDGTFAESTALGDLAFDGRGVAFADFDNDGDLDLCVTADIGDDTRLWRNDTNLGHGYLILRLRGTTSNLSGIGARIEVRTDADDGTGTQVREVSGGAGRGSQNSLPVEFGLAGATTIESVTIDWPSGNRQVLTSVAMNQILDVVEPIFSDGFESGDTSAWSLTVF